jgi:thioredoxin-related protein
MKLKLLSSIVMALGLAQAVSAANWLTDMSAAQDAAKKEKKLILVNFTGSDWCGWCIKLRNEVFSKPEFDAFAAQNLVLLEIDFPRKKAISAAMKKANGNLADKYKVNGYPTLHLLDPDGKSLGEFGYTPGGPGAFSAKVKSLGGSRIKGQAIAESRPPQPEASAEEDTPAPPPFNGAPTFPPKVYTQLELKGISGPPNKRFALINNQTIGVGESGKVNLGNLVVKVQCVEIHEDYVVVAVEGSKQRRELHLRNGLAAATPPPKTR